MRKIRVVNQQGQPLSATTVQMAKLLLKQGKAKVVEDNPPTIQLLYEMDLRGF